MRDFRILIFEPVYQTNAAAGIVVRGRSLHGRGAISQPGLQPQALGEVNVGFELAGACGALLGFQVNPLGNVPPCRNAGAGILSRLGIRGAGADAQAVQPQTLLNLDQGIQAVIAATRAGVFLQ